MNSDITVALPIGRYNELLDKEIQLERAIAETLPNTFNDAISRYNKTMLIRFYIKLRPVRSHFVDFMNTSEEDLRRMIVGVVS